MLRLDLLHPNISGNKWYKLKHNLTEARSQGKKTILTFGGAYSNHIAATAAACNQQGFQSIGIIRGDSEASNNHTLAQVRALGMQLEFISRSDYRGKTDPMFLSKLGQRFPEAYIIPEGGDNLLGEKGCGEILNSATDAFTTIFCAYGTGTTFRGIAASLGAHQSLTGVNVLKYEADGQHDSCKVLNSYHFGGYARHTPELLTFKTWFENRFAIPLDYVYTAKLCYAVFDLIKQGKIRSHERVLIVHSGGLQGNAGYEARYNLKPSLQVKEPQG